MVTRKYNATGITQRGPTLADCNFTLASQTHETIVESEVGSAVVSDDMNLIAHTAATVDYNYQVVPTITAGEDSYTFESLDTDVATIDQNGTTTRVGDGVARILVKKPGLLTRRIDINHTRQIGQATDIFDSWVTGSLAKECSDGVDSRIAGKTPSVAKPLFTTRDDSAGVYVRNTACWVADINTTCLSPWNAAKGKHQGGTLVSPRHIVFAKHWQMVVGTTIRFVTMDNVVVERTITAIQHVGEADWRDDCKDICVGVLDSDVPETISFAKILPYPIANYLPNLSQGIPIVSLDQDKKAGVSDYYYTLGSPSLTYELMKAPTNSTRLSFYEGVVLYDSGHPAFLIIDDELVLITTWFRGGAGSGSNYAYLKTEIETAMTTLGGGYGLTVKSLAAYPTY